MHSTVTFGMKLVIVNRLEGGGTGGIYYSSQTLYKLRSKLNISGKSIASTGYI